MKKILMVAAMLFAGMLTYCYGQDVKVNINNQDYSTNNGEFKINGISSSEDIGGVDVEFIDNHFDSFSVKFTNYNPFPVTVLAIVSYRFTGAWSDRTINIVLKTNGTKEIELAGSGCIGQIKGMIVRKVGN